MFLVSGGEGIAEGKNVDMTMVEGTICKSVDDMVSAIVTRLPLESMTAAAGLVSKLDEDHVHGPVATMRVALLD